MLRRGQKLYYRHAVPVDAQRLLSRLEVWRSLRTDSLSVAMRRLPSVVARIGMEIEHARAMAGLPIDATLLQPLKDDLPERVIDHLTLIGTDPIDGIGNDLVNRLTGNDAANLLDGGKGDDLLIGGAGDDVLIGATGNDVLTVTAVRTR